MNIGMIKTIAKTGLTIVNIAVTIYQVKQITESIKQNIDKNIEEQVREATGEKDFDLAEYRKNKELKTGKFLQNVKVNIDIDGTPLAVYVYKKVAYGIIQLLGLATLFYFGRKLIHKIPLPSFGRKLFKLA